MPRFLRFQAITPEGMRVITRNYNLTKDNFSVGSLKKANINRVPQSN